MDATKGYYCLIQFSPDASRAEAVNVGILLFCPELRFIAARIASGNRRAAKLVGRGNFDPPALAAAKRALERRFETDRDAFRTLDDLERFVGSRGNVLKLTAPRPIKVFDAKAEVDRLFDELVGGTPRRSPAVPVSPPLEELFRRLRNEDRARLDWAVTVPVLERKLHIPYAYRNGVWNLVLPHRFSRQEGPAVSAAMRLAIEGDLLRKHGADGEGEKQLIVVATFDSGEAVAKRKDRITQVLAEYHVQSVPAETIDGFIARVDREAHGVLPLDLTPTTPA